VLLHFFHTNDLHNIKMDDFHCHQFFLHGLKHWGHFSIKKHLELPFLLHTPKKTNKSFLESNHEILYLTCLKSCGTNFMKFDYIDWKIWAFKVGKKNWIVVCNFRWLWPPYVAIFCTIDFWFKKFCVDELSSESTKKIHKKNTWFIFFKKLVSRSRSKIERKTKSLMLLRWDWNTIIPTLRLFKQPNIS